MYIDAGLRKCVRGLPHVWSSLPNGLTHVALDGEVVHRLNSSDLTASDKLNGSMYCRSGAFGRVFAVTMARESFHSVYCYCLWLQYAQYRQSQSNITELYRLR